MGASTNDVSRVGYTGRKKNLDFRTINWNRKKHLLLLQFLNRFFSFSKKAPFTNIIVLQ